MDRNCGMYRAATFHIEGETFKVFIAPRGTRYTKAHDVRSILQVNASMYPRRTYAIEIGEACIYIKRWLVDTPFVCTYSDTEVITRSQFVKMCPRSPMQQYEHDRWYLYLFRVFATSKYEECLRKGINPVFESARRGCESSALAIVSLSGWPTAAMSKPNTQGRCTMPYTSDDDDFFDDEEIENHLDRVLRSRIVHWSSMNARFIELGERRATEEEYEEWERKCKDFADIDVEYASLIYVRYPNLLLQTVGGPMMPPLLHRQYRYRCWRDRYERVRRSNEGRVQLLEGVLSRRV